MNITGKIKVIGTPQTFSKGFIKREFVITTDDKYPQDIKFEVTKEDATNFTHKIGDVVDVHFNVRGNEWKGNYYVNLQAWKIESKGAGATIEVKVKVDEELPF